MCAVLEISPKTYYKYINKKDSDYSDYLITLIIMVLYLLVVPELVYLVRILIVV